MLERPHQTRDVNERWRRRHLHACFDCQMIASKVTTRMYTPRRMRIGEVIPSKTVHILRDNVHKMYLPAPSTPAPTHACICNVIRIEHVYTYRLVDIDSII